MTEILKILIPSLIALIGTLVGISVADRSWKYEQKHAELKVYQTDRRFFSVVSFV